jgi:hypothetical protein
MQRAKRYETHSTSEDWHTLVGDIPLSLALLVSQALSAAAYSCSITNSFGRYHPSPWDTPLTC